MFQGFVFFCILYFLRILTKQNATRIEKRHQFLRMLFQICCFDLSGNEIEISANKSVKSVKLFLRFGF